MQLRVLFSGCTFATCDSYKDAAALIEAECEDDPAWVYYFSIEGVASGRTTNLLWSGGRREAFGDANAELEAMRAAGER